MTNRGERGIWQRRYWELTTRDDRDFAAHMDHIHFSQVKPTVSWRTRRIGRIRHFVGASPAGYILPAGRAAAINRNRPANSSEPKQRKRVEERDR